MIKNQLIISVSGGKRRVVPDFYDVDIKLMGTLRFAHPTVYRPVGWAKQSVPIIYSKD